MLMYVFHIIYNFSAHIYPSKVSPEYCLYKYTSYFNIVSIIKLNYVLQNILASMGDALIWCYWHYLADGIFSSEDKKNIIVEGTLCPMEYAHIFIVLCIVVVTSSPPCDSYDAYTHNLQGYFIGTSVPMK